MKRVLQGALFLVLAIAGVDGAFAGQLKLNSGKSVELLEAREVEAADGKTLMLEYKTRLSLDDTATLRKEADEIWEKFVVEVERGGYKAATISARASKSARSNAATDPFHTAYKKINGAWRTRLRPAGVTAPLNEATIREIVDRQVWAVVHNNYNAWQLFVAKDWQITGVDLERTNRLNLDQYLAKVKQTRDAVEDYRYQFEIVDIAIDRKSGSARLEGRVFQSMTLNGKVIDVVARVSDVMIVQNGFMVWTHGQIVDREIVERPAHSGRRT